MVILAVAPRRESFGARVHWRRTVMPGNGGWCKGPAATYPVAGKPHPAIGFTVMRKTLIPMADRTLITRDCQVVHFRRLHHG
jgi:hypothetical protein